MNTLEERIATALSEGIASVDVATLITETEAAITAADAAAEAERMKALDPVASPDPARARAAMEAAAFTRDRLRTVLPRLQARLKQIEAAEYAAQWEPDYKQVEAVRDELAAEMREAYPAAAAQLADLFHRMAACDRECSRINRSAPPGDHRRLLGVELTARGVEGLLQPDVCIAEQLHLPHFARGNGPVLAWPPPAPPPWLASFWVPSGPGPDWQAGIAARNADRQEENDRAFSRLVERDRQRAVREEREGREAIEREVAERNRREGWPYP